MQNTPAGPSGAGLWLTLVAVAIAEMLDMLDTTVVAVANPAIAVELNTTLPQLEWVTNGYMLAMAVLLVTAGDIGDRFGHKRVFLAGLAGFAASSMMVGLSGDVTTLVVWRVVQGALGALLMATSLAILRITFPEDKLKLAVGVWSGTAAVAAASGPFVGGVIVQYAGWRWVFFLNVLLGAIGFVLGAVVIPRARPSDEHRRFDLTGVLLLSVTLFGLVWGIIRVAGHGWGSAVAVMCFALALVSGILFVLRERAAADPLLPLDLFRSAQFSAGVVIILVATCTSFGAWFYLALYLQQGRGLSPLQAGLALLSFTVLFAIGAPAGGKLNQRYGARLPILTGLLLIAAALLGLSMLRLGSSFHALWPYLVMLGLGVGLVSPTAAEVVVSNAPERLAGVAAGLQQTALMVGAVLGTAMYGTLISFRVTETLPEHLAAAGVPESTAAQVRDSAGAVTQGVVPVPPGTPEPQASAIVDAGLVSFVDGVSHALLVGTAVTVCCVLAGLLVKGGRQVAPEPRSRAAQ